MSTKILVVDDEEKIRETLRGVLSDEGYEVADAEDGRTALERLQGEPPDLVILDVWLPEIDGITLLEEIKRDGTRGVGRQRPHRQQLTLRGVRDEEARGGGLRQHERHRGAELRGQLVGGAVDRRRAQQQHQPAQPRRPRQRLDQHRIVDSTRRFRH